MQLLRNDNNWLRYRTLKKLKQLHPDLLRHEGLGNTFRRKLRSANSYWSIFFIVLTFLAIAGLSGLYLNQIFDSLFEPDSKTVIDSRLSNIIVSMSITLVVVGFLMNNLAVKESISYKVLFTHSYLYPIIYFTLITIGCLILVTSLSKIFCPKILDGVAIASVALTVIILFLIATLFRKIIRFTDHNTIALLMGEELLFILTKELKELWIRNISQQLFRSQMTAYGLTEKGLTNLLLNLYNQPQGSNTDKTSEPQKEISDINLTKILQFVQRKQTSSPNLEFLPLAIGTHYGSSDNYIFDPLNKNATKETAKLENYLILKTPVEDEYSSFMRYFNEKVINAIKQQDSLTLRKYLDTYLKVYELKMNHDLNNEL